MSKNRLDIDRVAFVGRTYAEYVKMFDLDESALRRGPVLDCPAGAASFAAEAHRLGLDVTACDILYGLTAGELADKGERDIAHIYEKVAEAVHLYRWEYYRNRDELIARRRKALELFMADFPEGVEKGRYVRAELPRLPFPDGSFSLVISSHFLFLYGDWYDEDFHRACIKELIRVSHGEVRIYPLSGLDAKPYPYMDGILASMRREGVVSETLEVPFEFQKGANRMLTFKRRKDG